MRLWHYRLIPVLSRQHLLGQWRECLAITGAIRKHGKVNHATVNRLNDFKQEHLLVYIELVRSEMLRRGYKTSDKSHHKLINDIGYDWDEPVLYRENMSGDVFLTGGQELFADFHNKRYLWQNLYMMQEKADTDQIEPQTWDSMITTISKKYPETTLLR